MTTPTDEPFEAGSEGDRAEQAQSVDVDEGTAVADRPSVSWDQAAEADALEQGSVVDNEDDEDL